MRDLVISVDRFPAAGETRLGGAFFEASGGKGSNQAVQAARCGANVTVVAAVGATDGGQQALALWEREGIDVRHVAQDPVLPTGVAMILVNSSGENQIVIAPGANERISPDMVEAADSALTRAKLVMAQLEVPFAAVRHGFARARQTGATTLLNAAPASRTLPASFWQDVDILIVNETEAETLVGAHHGASLRDIGDALRPFARVAIVVTVGREGAYLLQANAAGPSHHRAMSVDVVDTTGAGDAFIGAFAARYVESGDLESAVDWGVAAGSLACTARGALARVLSAGAVREAIRAQNETNVPAAS